MRLQKESEYLFLRPKRKVRLLRKIVVFRRGVGGVYVVGYGECVVDSECIVQGKTTGLCETKTLLQVNDAFRKASLREVWSPLSPRQYLLFVRGTGMVNVPSHLPHRRGCRRNAKVASA